MEKISKKELSKIIKEEFFRALKKKELTKKLQAINEEISKIEEVEAGEEMSGGDFDGQKTPEFEKKGSSIMETQIGENMSKMYDKFLNLGNGNEVMFWDQNIGTFDGENLNIHPDYANYVDSELAKNVIKSKIAAGNSQPIDSSLGECEDMAEGGLDFETVDGGEEIEFTSEPGLGETESEFESMPEPIMENKNPGKKDSNEWLFEGKNRMLKLGGLLREEE